MEETTTLIPLGNQREDLEGIETSILMEEQREDPEATTTPIPQGSWFQGQEGQKHFQAGTNTVLRACGRSWQVSQ